MAAYGFIGSACFNQSWVSRLDSLYQYQIKEYQITSFTNGRHAGMYGAVTFTLAESSKSSHVSQVSKVFLKHVVERMTVLLQVHNSKCIREFGH